MHREGGPWPQVTVYVSRDQACLTWNPAPPAQGWPSGTHTPHVPAPAQGERRPASGRGSL